MNIKMVHICLGNAVAQCFRCCATNRRVAGSIQSAFNRAGERSCSALLSASVVSFCFVRAGYVLPSSGVPTMKTNTTAQAAQYFCCGSSTLPAPTSPLMIYTSGFTHNCKFWKVPFPWFRLMWFADRYISNSLNYPLSMTYCMPQMAKLSISM